MDLYIKKSHMRHFTFVETPSFPQESYVFRTLCSFWNVNSIICIQYHVYWTYPIRLGGRLKKRQTYDSYLCRTLCTFWNVNSINCIQYNVYWTYPIWLREGFKRKRRVNRTKTCLFQQITHREFCTLMLAECIQISRSCV